MKQKMTRFLNHENLENQLILLRKNHMINSNLPTKIREEPIIGINRSRDVRVYAKQHDPQRADAVHGLNNVKAVNLGGNS